MTTLSRIAGVVSGLMILSCILACGAISKVNEAKARVQASNDLKQIALTWISYCDDHSGKTPASQQELLDWAQKKMPEAVGIIQQTGPGGKYTVRWGNYRFPGSFPDGTSNTPLAWENQVPTAGGMIAMADGSTRQVTAQEFAQSPKPKSADGK
jgi:hypothetical protein